MTEPLQQFGWKKSNYDRPTDKWVCGALCNGGQCKTGPTTKGVCQGTITGKDGIKQTCRPKRSLLQKRRIATVTGIAMSLSVCLLLWNSSSSGVISPGALTAHHSSSTMSCADCHSADSHAWTQAVFQTNTSIADSKLCLNCHQDLGPEPLLAHSLTLENLESLMEGKSQSEFDIQSMTLAASSAFVSSEAKSERTCNVCHQEHHGRMHDLNKFTNQQCQSCHAEQFHSFEKGHPDFLSSYGNRVDGIQFDHASHLLQYFRDDAQRLMPDATPPSDCSACHLQNADGSKMLTRGFEQMCSSCHEQGVRDQEFPGVPFFALPETSTKEVGEWPEAATGQTLSNAPAYMQILLSWGSKEMSETETAWSIKELFQEISLQGEQAILNHLPEKWQGLGKLQPSIVPVFLHAQQLWFPNLNEELSLKAQDQTFDTRQKQQPSESKFPLESNIGGGWSLNPADHSIRYRPIGHADPVIKRFLEVSLKNWSTRTNDEEAKIIQQQLEQLMNPTGSGNTETKGAISSGRCLACHTVEKDAESLEWKIIWESKDAENPRSALTRFTHGPHLKNGIIDKCSNCHKINQFKNTNAEPILTAFERIQREIGTPAMQNSFSHGLKSISKESCATCHNQQSQLDNCTQCHQYHAMQRKH